jgi:predicted nucleic acid-binding protein
MQFEFVSNTTPILNFLKLQRLDILKDVVKTLIIPDAVFQEIESGKKKAFYDNIKNYPWIEILELKEKSSLDLLLELDKGEAETIALAKELKINKVIIDEKLGRRYAQELGLTPVGTLGILLKAKEIGIIEKIKPYLSTLEINNTWFDGKLKMHVLKKAKEF